MSGGKLSTVLSTRGGTSLKDNFTLIFGIKSVYLSNINLNQFLEINFSFINSGKVCW